MKKLIKQKIRFCIAYIEIRRIALDPHFEVLGLDLTVKKFLGNVGREVDVHVDLLQGLIPFENLLT